LELNGTHQLQVCGDVHLLGENMNIIKKNAKSLLDVGKEADIEVNTEDQVDVPVLSPDCRTFMKKLRAD
jgi:hypothetical protein